MNKDNMLSNLTIVLCVYGRSEFSERFLKYMDKIGYYFPILVADGDDSPQLKNLILAGGFSVQSRGSPGPVGSKTTPGRHQRAWAGGDSLLVSPSSPADL